jgi:hypothetical protein
MLSQRPVVVGFSVLVLFSGPALADEMSWGNLKARVIYDSLPPPVPAKLAIDKDKAFCGSFELRDETLLVDKDGGLANVVVWLDSKIAAPKVHPDYEMTAKDKVTVDSRGCRFVPHVALLRTTQTLEVRNSDPLAHNARFDPMMNTPFNVILVADATFSFPMEKAERLPARLTCAIHPWRLSYLLIQDHPYMAVSDARGHLEIPKLPVGKWTFVFWHEKAGYLRSVEKGGEKVEWLKGRVEIDIKPIKNDIGEIKLAPEIFEVR